MKKLFFIVFFVFGCRVLMVIFLVFVAPPADGRKLTQSDVKKLGSVYKKISVNSKELCEYLLIPSLNAPNIKLANPLEKIKRMPIFKVIMYQCKKTFIHKFLYEISESKRNKAIALKNQIIHALAGAVFSELWPAPDDFKKAFYGFMEDAFNEARVSSITLVDPLIKVEALEEIGRCMKLMEKAKKKKGRTKKGRTKKEVI